MRTQHPTFIPHSFDGLDLYARLCINLPPIAATSYRYLKNTIRASPPVPPHGRLPGKAARMDFALIRTGEYNEKTVGMPLEGVWSFRHSDHCCTTNTGCRAKQDFV